MIRTTQTTTKQQGATLRALTESMQKDGFIVEPDKLIDVVRMPDGGLTSLKHWGQSSFEKHDQVS
jgi:hypothetical protein